MGKQAKNCDLTYNRDVVPIFTKHKAEAVLKTASQGYGPTGERLIGGAAVPRDDGFLFMHGEGIQSCSCCGVVAERLCDYPLGKGETCDAPLCTEHSMRQTGADEMDFCPAHHVMSGGKADPSQCRMSHAEHARLSRLADEGMQRWIESAAKTGRIPSMSEQEDRWLREFDRASLLAVSQDHATGVCPTCGAKPEVEKH